MSFKKSIWLIMAVALVLLGAKAIKENVFTIGDGAGNDKAIVFDIGAGEAGNPRLKWDNGVSRLQFTNDNVNIFDIGSGSGGSGGGINILANAGAENSTANWVNSGGGAFSATTTAANVAVGGKAFDWDSSAATDTLTSDAVSVDDFKVIQDRLCVMSFWYLGGDANIDAQVWDGSTALKTLTLEPAATYKSSGDVTFVCPSTGTLALRFLANADAAQIFIDETFIGTRIPAQGSVVTDWGACSDLGVTITPNFTPNVGLDKCRRVGDMLHIQAYHSASSDWATTGNFAFVVSGVTLDGTKMGFNGSRNAVGTALAFDTNVADYYGGTVISNPVNNDFALAGDAPNSIWSGTTLPFAWANGADVLSYSAQVPVVEWSGTSLVFQPTADDLALTGWTDCGSLTTENLPISASTCKYQRVGDSMHWAGFMTLSGGVTGTPEVDVPGGFTMDTSKLAGPTTTRGVAHGYDSGSNQSWVGIVRSSSGNQIRFTAADGTAQEWGATSPFTWVSTDTISFETRIPITEWSDLGSIPAIGVEVAGIDVVGLAGPTNDGIEDGTGEVCGVNCDSCDVSSVIWNRVGNQVNFAFTAAMDATTDALLTECDFDPFGGMIGANFTGLANVTGVCRTRDSTNDDDASGIVFADIATDKLQVRIQNPFGSALSTYFCTGIGLIK